MTEQDNLDSRENRQNPESPDNASASERPARAPRLRAERMQKIPAHLEGCAALEKLCFREPWSAHSLELLCTDGIGVGFLCTGSIPPGGGQGVVAYGGMMVAVDEGQITNIAVHPGCRRKGYGQAVLTALIRYAKSAHLASVTLEVRPSNQAALALYRHSGFSEVGRRKNFYTKPTEDAPVSYTHLTLPTCAAYGWVLLRIHRTSDRRNRSVIRHTDCLQRDKP